jgi:alkylhydroperoxidase family enzyme
MPRVQPLTAEQAPDPAGATLRSLEAERGYRPTLHATLAHSPAVLGQFLDMTAALRDGLSLDPRLRELAILATANTTGAAVQWLAHIPPALAAGLTPEQVLALPVWRSHSAFSPDERSIIEFAETLTRDGRVPEAAWADARHVLHERGVVELTAVVGFYNMVSRVLLALSIEPDPEYAAAASAALVRAQA